MRIVRMIAAPIPQRIERVRRLKKEVAVLGSCDLRTGVSLPGVFEGTTDCAIHLFLSLHAGSFSLIVTFLRQETGVLRSYTCCSTNRVNSSCVCQEYLCISDT